MFSGVWNIPGSNSACYAPRTKGTPSPNEFAGVVNWFTADRGTGRSLSIIKQHICPTHLYKQLRSRSLCFPQATTANTKQTTTQACYTASEMAHTRESLAPLLYFSGLDREKKLCFVLVFVLLANTALKLGFHQVYIAL